MSYLTWAETILTDFGDENINSLYNQGFVFTRKGKGVMNQTRSLRIDLSKFELSSENKRILKKTEGIELKATPLPHPNYDWTTHKMGKDFYEKKFGEKIFSANKLKELMTDEKKSNFNLLLEYTFTGDVRAIHELPLHHGTRAIGYCICFQNTDLLHYCYPFYDLDVNMPNIGMSMMLRAILWAKEKNNKYVYLGSASRPCDTYKFQFEGVECWNPGKWSDDLREVKQLLK